MNDRKIGDGFLKGVTVFGVILMLVGIYCWVFRKMPTEGLFFFGCGFILFYMFAMVANRIIIQSEGIVLSAFLRKRKIAYADIDFLDYKITGKLLATNYTGILHMKNGLRRKVLSRSEEALLELREVIHRAQAKGYSERAGEIIYLR